MDKKITVQAEINAPIEKVWEFYTMPEHIVLWNNASDDWHTTRAENDLRVGGSFLSRMEAKDGSEGFDFGGVYDTVIVNDLIEYTMGDGRKVKVSFREHGGGTQVTVEFDAESSNPVDFQREGWQAILNNFKNYIEINN